MRRLRLLVVPFVLLMVAAACSTDSGDGDGDGGGASEDTGRVNVLNALSAEEGAALQAVIDDTITGVEYEVEVEASDQFEEQLQIRAEGGTLDIILLPQPGAVQAQAASGQRRLARGPRVRHRRAHRDLR